MNGFMRQSVFMATISLIGIVFAGCEQPEHRVAQPKPGAKIACQLCYDEVNTVQRRPPRSDTPWNVVIRTHMCPDCKTKMSIYREEGVLMVKCAHCAPDGLACDKCLPPDAPVR